MSDFETAKAERDVIESEVSAADIVLKAFPKNAIGLTPDAVRATPEWQAANVRFRKAFERLRTFNARFTKRFAREIRAERQGRAP